MDGIVNVFLNNLLGFDWIIFVMAGVNVFVYYLVLRDANRIYNHFNAQDRIVNLNSDVKLALRESTSGDSTRLTASELLKLREQTNKSYAYYSNITTMFPLMGMLGTVVSLIPMVNSIGTMATELFFAALTSTLWGIIAALVFKFLDSSISYKIDDNEKHMEYIFNPGKRIIRGENDEKEAIDS